MNTDTTATLIEDYKQQKGLYTDFAQTLESLLQEMLKQKGIRVHSIASRVKEEDSFAGKVSRSEGKYTELQEITDLAGIRIITYFDDEVDAIAELVEREFVIDEENSVDKRTLLDPDRFGYLSLHYVVGLSDQRAGLMEYARFQGCKAEIQIRSILQHTWAEIEHDLGYKTKQAIPREIRRSFSRLAGLLELADREFAKIRDDLREYEEDVQEQISDRPERVLIDQTSLKSYIACSQLVFEMDTRLVAAAQAQAVITSDSFVGQMVERLQYFGLQTISDVETTLQNNHDLLLAFAERWLSRRGRIPSLHVGVVLLYLCYLLAARTGATEQVYRFLDENGFGGSAATKEKYAKEILMTYQELTLA
ncbi:MAG TPA: hypothetical protein VFV52_01545 [Bacilli bacterium]|nr:hypothetical protein [Bacilli bacterium]